MGSGISRVNFLVAARSSVIRRIKDAASKMEEVEVDKIVSVANKRSALQRSAMIPRRGVCRNVVTTISLRHFLFVHRIAGKKSVNVIAYDMKTLQ